MRAREFTDKNFNTSEIDEGELYSYYKKKYELYESKKFPHRIISSIKHKNITETDSHGEIGHFINTIEKIDFTNKIKVGDQFAVLDFEINFAWKEITGRGFTKTKRITKISSSRGKINYVEFDDGDRYPRLNKQIFNNNGKLRPLEYAAYFKTTKDAEHALMLLELTVPNNWSIDVTEVERINDISETVNDKLFFSGYEKKKEVLNGDVVLVASAGYVGYGAKPNFRSKQFRIVAKSKKGTEIGWVNFEKHEDHLEALDLNIIPAFRRKGIATEMYKFAKELGNDIAPSKLQTSMGKLFWNRDHS